MGQAFTSYKLDFHEKHFATFLILEMKEGCQISKETPLKEPVSLLFLFSFFFFPKCSIQNLTCLETGFQMSQKCENLTLTFDNISIAQTVK